MKDFTLVTPCGEKNCEVELGFVPKSTLLLVTEIKATFPLGRNLPRGMPGRKSRQSGLAARVKYRVPSGYLEPPNVDIGPDQRNVAQHCKWKRNPRGFLYINFLVS
jgi:hypothetical protein